MPALRRPAVCLVLACPLALGATPSHASESPLSMVARINQVRTTHGLSALQYSPSLARSSSRFARHLVRVDRFAHGARIMASSRFSRLGEVLALTHGWRIRRRQTLKNWLSSPSHRALLLSSSFRYVGAGRVRGYFGAARAVVWTVQFGR